MDSTTYLLTNLELNSWNITIILLALLISYQQLLYFYQHYVSSVPIIGNSWSDWYQGLKTNSVLGPKWYVNAYEKYSKHSRPFRLDPNTYVLPISLLSEHRKLGPSTLHPTKANDDVRTLSRPLVPSIDNVQKLFIKGTSGPDTYGHDNWDNTILAQREITPSLDKILPVVQEQIKHDIARFFIDETPQVEEKWHEVGLSSQTYKVIGTLSTRLLLGKRHSIDDDCVKHVTGYTRGVGAQGLLLHLFVDYCPSFILTRLPAGRHLKALEKLLRPEILQRMHNPKEMDEQNQEVNVLWKMVDYVKNSPLYANAKDEDILQGVKFRLGNIMFATVDTTWLTTNRILDNLTSYPRTEYADPIREQIQRVLSEHGGQWSLEALGQLNLLDSFIKETMRYRPFSTTMLYRQVIAKGGYTYHPKAADAKPVHVPQGAVVELPILGIQHDPDNYADAESFKGFRFVRDTSSALTPTDKFLFFGQGSHACPGRFLAFTILKVIVIELLTNYEWKHASISASTWLGRYEIPDQNSKLIIRKL